MSIQSSDPAPREPTERPDILNMSQDELDALVTSLQDKRMLTRKRYEEAELARKRVRDEKTRAQMETCLMRMHKATIAIDKHIAKFEKDYSTLMTLKRIAAIEEGDHDVEPTSA